MAEDKEIKVMGIVAEAIAELDEDARKRVILWLMSREGVSSSKAVSTSPQLQSLQKSTGELPNDKQSLSDFFYSVDPQSDMERAIAIAGYLQTVGGREEFSSQEINDELKHLGYPIANI